MSPRGLQQRSVPSHKATADILLSGGVQGTLTVTATAQEVIVGSSVLTWRKTVYIYNTSSKKNMYWGFIDTITGVTDAFPIFPEERVEIEAGQFCPIYIVSDSGDITAIIAEAG